jgi:hypothetical protein
MKISPALLFVCVLLLGACRASLPSCASPDPKAIATSLRSREQFRAMLTDVVKLTMTGRIVAKTDPSGFEKRLPIAVEHALDRHADQWDANLGDAYAETLSRHELVQLCKALNENDYGKFGQFVNRVGVSMKEKSTPLLQIATAEAIKELFEGTTFPDHHKKAS